MCFLSGIYREDYRLKYVFLTFIAFYSVIIRLNSINRAIREAFVYFCTRRNEKINF